MASRQQATQNDVKKRCWSSAEEEVLLTSLKGLVATGWKSDNGFRGGYIVHLETAMKKAFPQTDLRGKPHIESKLTAWKRTYATLRDIIARSGVGFNVNGDNRIDCDNDAWEEICVSELGIPRSWRNKQWDYLEAWKMCFGKDRATGEGGAEFIQMVNEVMDENAGRSVKERNDGETFNRQGVDDAKPMHEGAPNHSVGQSTYERSKTSRNPKKRQFEDIISSLVDLVGDIQKTNVAKYQVFNDAFGKKAVAKKERGDLWPILESIEGLTLDEMFEVGEKLLKMPERLELFFSLSEGARPAYIQRMRLMSP